MVSSIPPFPLPLPLPRPNSLFPPHPPPIGIPFCKSLPVDSLCDRCRFMLAVRYCEIDGVYLCFPCDADFHSGDTLRSSHSRSLVAHRGLIKPAARTHQSLPVVSVSSNNSINNLSSGGFPTPGVVGTPTLFDPLPPPEGGSLLYACRDNGGLEDNVQPFDHPLIASSSSVIPVPTPDCNATLLPSGADQGQDQGSYELDHPDEMWLQDFDLVIDESSMDKILNNLRKDDLPAAYNSEQGNSATLQPSSFPDGLSPGIAYDNGTGGSHLCPEMWLRVPGLVIDESNKDEILDNLRKDDLPAAYNSEQGNDQGRCGLDHPDEMVLLPSQHLLDQTHIEEIFVILEKKDNLPASHSSELGNSATLQPSSFPDGLAPGIAYDIGTSGSHLCPEMRSISLPTIPFNCHYQESPNVLSAQSNWHQERERAIARYRERKPRRHYGKHIIYPARKARAEVRKRVHGRFVKASSDC